MITFRTASREEWRACLLEHTKHETEIWFVFPMKAAGEASISYNDAVEEALCFGWIDSTIRHIDPLHRAQRFTPRRKGSPYSRPNIERLILMDKRGLLLSSVRESVAALIDTPYQIPADILEALMADSETWEHFSKMPAGYQRIRTAYIDSARKRPDEFAKRLSSFLCKTKAGQMIKGFGGIEKYYTD